jgi:hypothetical protein
VRVGCGLGREFVGIFVGILGNSHKKSIDISVCYDISEVPLLAPLRPVPQFIEIDIARA